MALDRLATGVWYAWWDSNPHCTDFKSVDSACWPTRAVFGSGGRFRTYLHTVIGCAAHLFAFPTIISWANHGPTRVYYVTTRSRRGPVRPLSSPLKHRQANESIFKVILRITFYLERLGGIEPPHIGWKPTALPLSYSRVIKITNLALSGGFEPTILPLRRRVLFQFSFESKSLRRR